MLVFLLLSCRPDQPPPEEASAGLHPEQGLAFVYRPGEVEVTGADWSVTLRPLDWGREHRRSFAAVDGVQDGALVRYVEAAAEAWYLVEPRGLEQGFELLERPGGEGPMGVRVALDTELAVTWRADGVDLSDASGWAVARYEGLVVVDAAGQVLPSTLTLSCDPDCVVNLTFDDTDARYPITVDPLLFGTLTTLPVAFAGTGIGGDLDGDVAVLSGVNTSTVIHRFGSGTWSWEASVVGTPPSGRPAVSGDLLAVPRFQGVDVFVHTSGTWTALSPQPVTGGGFLGSRVAIDGTRLVHSVPGGVEVFNWNGSTFVAGPTYSGGFQFSPRPVAISGTWFVTHEANSLLFFDISTGLVGPITLTGVGTFTGDELQMHGDRVVLGAQSFAFDGTTWAAEGAIPYAGAISSVTVRGDRVIYSDEATGQLTVFRHDGSAWILADTFSHGTTQFGRSVALG